MSRIRAPDNKVAGLHGTARDVSAARQHRPGVGAGVLAAVGVDLRAGPAVAERREAGAVGVERKLLRMVEPVDGAELLVVDRGLVLDPPARELDDLRPEARLRRRLLQAAVAADLERRGQRLAL